MRGEGLRTFSKSQLLRITEVALRNQHAAENAARWRRWTAGAAVTFAFNLGALATWLLCR